MLERFFYVPSLYEHVPCANTFFEKEQPIFIEYCSGNGQWIEERAKCFPQINWLAVEKRFDRARKIWLKSFKSALSNLFVACAEGLTFTRYYAPKAAQIFINFPDPWPKRRHAPNRLICPPFLEALANIVAPGGKTICTTDDPQYASQMVKEFERSPLWKVCQNTTAPSDYGRSFFYDLWLEKGKTIHYLEFERC